VVVGITGISGGGVGSTPTGSLGGGTLSGTGEGRSIGSGCGGISGGSGGRIGSGAGSGTRGSDILRGEGHRSTDILARAPGEHSSAVQNIMAMRAPYACGYFGSIR
jgi:hypothetical protein